MDTHIRIVDRSLRIRREKVRPTAVALRRELYNEMPQSGSPKTPGEELLTVCQFLGYYARFDAAESIEDIEPFPTTEYNGGFWLALAPYLTDGSFITFERWGLGGARWTFRFENGQIIRQMEAG